MGDSWVGDGRWMKPRIHGGYMSDDRWLGGWVQTGVVSS